MANGYFDQRQENDEYEINAAYDAKAEAFGDPCPGCKRLRGGGDCWFCFDDGYPTSPEDQAPPELVEAAPVARPAVPADWGTQFPPSDDIEF